MATIKDVASLAGVSTATVSRVINQTAWVEPVTRERVEKAMRDLNYRRNAAAIALAKRSGDMLGLLTGNLADPFFARLARGVEDVSRKQQYRLMVCSGGHDEDMEKAGLDFLVNQGCEAIVVHASRLADKELLRYAAHFPALVVVNRYIAGMANRCIWLENRSAAREATRYLLANGHRRIACVTSDLPIIDRQERLDGYRQALEEYGISPDPCWVISVPFNEEGGERAAHQLINSGLPLTAAVTFNDVMAAGIMRILHQRGVHLPQQLSIVGFDDLFLGVIMQGLSIKQGLDAFIDGFDIAMFPQGAEGVVADVPRLLNRGGMFSMMGTILLVFCAFSFAGALTLTGALTIIINRLLTIIHSVGQLIAATIGTTILVTGATSDGKLALLVPAELFKDAYRRMGLDTKNLSRTIEDAGTVIEPLLPWTSAGVYMATTLGVSTLDLLPWAIQCYAAIFFALIYGFSGIGIARTAPASEKSPQSSVTE